MVDVFDEVEEQLRSDRYKSLALKSLPWLGVLAAVAILAVGAWWGWTHYQEGQIAKASEAYQAALESEQKIGPVKAFPAFEAISKTGPAVYKTLALIEMGGARLEENKTPEAVVYFDQAAKLAPNPILADLAGLNSALALLDTASYKDVEARLTPLMGEKSPYRVQAKEALAFAKLQAGDLAGARADFSVLSNSLDNPSDEVRQRAQGAIAMIDSGSAKNLAAVVKAAKALPPSALQAPPAGLPAALNSAQ
ncbi:tetratricopeptide repeat protein [Caulobacter sp. DWP3-1-3b2]|uniref:tetratricopeptide repeat protein n=1 Tax=unclassified Caulobacter TaxID=2648921 RepID=UPI003CF0CCB3